MACGKAGPATLLASAFGCSIVGVERSPEFAAAARDRVAAAGLAERVEIVEGDAAAFSIDPGSFDAALCLGASFVWDGLDGTLAALDARGPRGRPRRGRRAVLAQLAAARRHRRRRLCDAPRDRAKLEAPGSRS